MKIQPNETSEDEMKPTLERIWNEFAAKLGRFISPRVADPETAEDILQDMFVKLQTRLDEFQDPAKLQGWLFLVARNAIIDYYRTRKKTSEFPDSLPTELPERKEHYEITNPQNGYFAHAGGAGYTESGRVVQAGARRTLVVESGFSRRLGD